MANVSRIILDHPALGTAGGAGLHASIQAIYKKLGDNIADRLFYAENLNNSASVDLEHNFGVGLADIRWDLYIWDTGTQVLTRVTSTSSPTLSTFVVAETSGFEETKLTLTNNSGAQRDLVLCAFNDPINIGELVDVDLVTTPPQDADGLIFDAAALKWIPGSSSGLGELSVIKFGSKEGDAVASGAGVTLDTTTTASELPLEGVIKSGIKITGVSGSDYVRWRWTMPDSFLNRTHKVEWEQKFLGSYASGDFLLELHTNSASNYGGSYTQKTFHNGTVISKLDGKFTDYFDAGSELYYELRIKRVAGTDSIVLANLIVGPGIQPQGAVISDFVELTPAIGDFSNATGLGLTSANSFLRYRQIGNHIQIKARYELTGTGSDSGAFRWNYAALGSGITLDVAKAPEFAIANRLGSGEPNYGILKFVNASYAEFGSDGSASSARGDEFGAGAGLVKFVSFDVMLPVSELAGKGLLNTGANDVEYAFNTSTNTTSNDSTSFGYGPQGALTAAITSNLWRAVNFNSPIQPTDKITLEFSHDRVTWIENNAWQYIGPTYIVQPAALQNSVFFGAGIDGSHGFSLTNSQIAIKFNTYSATTGGQGYGGTGVAWPASDLYWRVKKEKSGVAVGFGLADASGNSGLVSPYNPAGGGVVYADTYTPTLTNVSNAGALANEVAWYQRVGKFVTVYGSITLTPSSGGGTATSVGITLPIATNLTSSNQIRGTGVYEATSRDIAYVGGDATNDRAELSFKANATGNDRVGFHFSYMLQ